MTQAKSPQIEALVHLIHTVHSLRAPGGCPWDRAQTHQSLRQYLIEEAYEVLDVLDQINKTEDLQVEKIKGAFREELGDLLMQVMLHSEMASETGAFDVYDVAKALDEKLIRRHPHVFGEVKADSADIAIQSWEKEKAKEKASNLDASILDGVPRGLPSLQKAARILEKVTKVGFQWENMDGPIEKVEEEWNELKAEIQQLEKFVKNSKQSDSLKAEPNFERDAENKLRKKVESEMGDLLFTLCNVSYLMKLNPEDALRGTLVRFENRFRHVERGLKEMGKTPEQSDLKEMDRFWDEAKKIEKCQVWGLTGGIAAGKSTVAKLLSDQGIPVIDADQISKDLIQSDGAGYTAVLKRFGTVDKAQLREIVFKDSQAKKDLEQILHPLIQAESKKRIQKLAIQNPLVIYEAALLVETGRHQDFSGIIVVEAPYEIRLKRLLTRPGMSPEIAKKILASQISDDEQTKHADFVLENSGDLEELQKKVRGFIEARKPKGEF